MKDCWGSDAPKDFGSLNLFRTFENFQYFPPVVRAKEMLESGISNSRFNFAVQALWYKIE
jgi:hypothetical protein